MKYLHYVPREDDAALVAAAFAMEQSADGSPAEAPDDANLASS
jgi:hypothetical protein